MNFNDLRSINVGDHIEKKNGLSYLSWAYAVDELLQRDPSATWEFLPEKTYYTKQTRYGKNKEPYEVEGNTVMVFCSVTAFGKTMTAQLPVMDNRNQSIIHPDAMDINKAMQRCLAKAIGLHGIGLYIYAGEDIPEPSLDDYIKRIQCSNSMDELKAVFAEGWKVLNGEARNQLKEVYEKRKSDLSK